MKVRLVHLVVLLLGLMLNQSATAVAGSSPSKAKYYGQGEGHVSIPQAKRVVAINPLLGTSGLPASRQPEEKQFKISPDVAMHGSVTAVCNGCPLLIGIIHLHESEPFSRTGSRPAQHVLFRILFRLIIAPNAP